MRLKVFIASSSEGLEVAKAVRGLLLQELGEEAEVTIWTREFEFSSAYIESLERVSRESDFAVLVLTPDDVTTSRKAKKLAPRDNVIFELGLFIGSLGRERCFIVHEQRQDLKLPTDLLGVKAATFKSPGDGGLKEVLDTQAFLISERITNLDRRHKLSTQALADLMAMRSFYDRIKGAWWERITVDGEHRISFFQIEMEELYNSVQLDNGRVYDKEGPLNAHWKSIVTRVLRDEKKVYYLRRCWHPSSPNVTWFHGFGEMDFEGSDEPGEVINRGNGKFWDIDQAQPERTVVRPVELRRIVDKNDLSIMNTGNEKNVRSLIEKTIREWPV